MTLASYELTVWRCLLLEVTSHVRSAHWIRLRLHMCQASSCIPPHQPLRVSSQRTQLNGEIRIRGPSLSSAGPSTGLSDLAPKKKTSFMIRWGFKHLLSYSGMKRFIFCFSRCNVKTDSIFPQVHSQHWTWLLASPWWRKVNLRERETANRK